MGTEAVLDALDAIRIAATRVVLRDFPAPKPVATTRRRGGAAPTPTLSESAGGPRGPLGDAIRPYACAARTYRSTRGPCAAAPPGPIPAVERQRGEQARGFRAVAPTLAVLAFRDAARAVLRARDDGTTDDVRAARGRGRAHLPDAGATRRGRMHAAVLHPRRRCARRRGAILIGCCCGSTSTRPAASADGLARGGGTEVVRLAASDAAITAVCGASRPAPPRGRPRVPPAHRESRRSPAAVRWAGAQGRRGPGRPDHHRRPDRGPGRVQGRYFDCRVHNLRRFQRRRPPR